MRLFYRNGWYYARYLNAIFQIPSVHDLCVQAGPLGLGWGRFMMADRPLGIRVIEKRPDRC